MTLEIINDNNVLCKLALKHELPNWRIYLTINDWKEIGKKMNWKTG